MTKTQIDLWFSLDDRVARLVSRQKIDKADASALLKPIREIADLDIEGELSISEREIARVERTGVLLGSAESLSASQSKERADLFFKSRTNR